MTSQRYQSFYIRVWFSEPPESEQLRIFVQTLPKGQPKGFVRWQDVISYLDNQVQLFSNQNSLSTIRRNNNEEQ